MPGEFVPIAIVLIVVGLPVICGTLIKLAKIMRGDDPDGGSPRKGKGKRAESEQLSESQLIQEIHRGLSRLEERIESLETIVIQSENKKTSPRS